MWNKEYLYLAAIAFLVLYSTILMVWLLLERRNLKRLSKLITEAQVDFIKYSSAVEHFKHIDALSKNGLYSSERANVYLLTKRNNTGTLH